MSDEQKREHLETSKQESIVVREWAWTAAALSIAALCLTMLIVTLVWGVPTLIAAKGYWTGETKVLKEKIEPIVDNLADLVTDATATAGNAKTITDEAARRAPQIFSHIDEVPIGLRRVEDAAATQITQAGAGVTANLSSTKRLIDNVEPNVTRASENVKDATRSLAVVTKALEDAVQDPKVKNFIDDAMKRGAAILGNLDTVTGNLVLVTADGHRVMLNVEKGTNEAAAMLGDLQTYSHNLMFPPPVTGFWPNVLRGLKIVGLPVMDAAKLYFTIRPVSPTVTVPAPKP